MGPLPPPYGGPEVMTKTLVEALRRRDNPRIQHINSQVSRSLAEKGGKHQLRKSIAGLAQATALVRTIVGFHPEIVYLPLTNSPSFLGFLRDCLFIVPGLLLGKKVAIRLHGGYYFYAHRRGLQRELVRAVLGRVSLAMVQGRRLTGEFDGLIPDERIA